jgi:HAD superfamily phosphoserine phosphatase-like hydrolase
MKKNKHIAIFDFDNTITCTDTFRDFFGWNFGYAKVFLIHSLLFPLVILGFFSTFFLNVFKRILVFIFLRDLDIIFFVKLCENYSYERLIEIISKDALNKIIWHQSKGHDIIIVSGSLSSWITPWAAGHGINLVFAAEPEVVDFKLTGLVSEPFYYGINKLNALEKLGVNKFNSVLYCYGDSSSDKYILKASTYPFYRKF